MYYIVKLKPGKNILVFTPVLGQVSTSNCSGIMYSRIRTPK